MGASLALALKKKGYACKIVGIVRSEKSKQEGIALNIADEILIEEEFLKSNAWYHYDFIIFSLPVDLTCDKIKLIPSDYNGFITDLGSTKKAIIETVEEKYTTNHNYYSSHPMAGSEQSGLNFAKPDLYEGRLCILTEPKNVNRDAIEKITMFWREVGAIPLSLGADDHDEVLAYLSHTPHILSSLLVNWAYQNPKVKRNTDCSPIAITGGGFRDMSRIAGSNPEMWNAIIQTNKDSIMNSLLEFRGEIDKMIQQLKSNDQNDFWRDYFLQAKDSRNKILKIQE